MAVQKYFLSRSKAWIAFLSITSVSILHVWGFMYQVPQGAHVFFDFEFRSYLLFNFYLFFMYCVFFIKLMWIIFTDLRFKYYVMLIHSYCLPMVRSMRRFRDSSKLHRFREIRRQRSLNYVLVFCLSIVNIMFLFFKFYGGMNWKLSVKSAIFISLFLVLVYIYRIRFVEIFNNVSKIFVNPSRYGAPISIVLVFFLAFSVLMGESRAIRLMSNDASVVLVGKEFVERVVFAKTSDGYVLFNKDDNEFEFLTDSEFKYTKKIDK